MAGMNYTQALVKLLHLVYGNRGGFMEKNDLLILKAFILYKVPNDFYNTPNKIVMIDSITGLAERVYHGKKINKTEIQNADLDEATKKEINHFLSNKPENLSFYYLLKLVILILYKNAILVM